MEYGDQKNGGRLLHTVFESQVSSSPYRDALQVYNLESFRIITYDELNSEANRIARLMQSINTAKDKTFAICMDKGPTLVAVILAVLKLGCAWSPVDPRAPVKRKSAILQALGSCHLLVVPEYAADFQQHPLSTNVVVWDDDFSKAVCVQGSDNLQYVNCSPESPCHVLWTSGSTGIPKGQFKPLIPLYPFIQLIQITY
jgi:acyl-coenzyme A synthetase/AMP-(fatty) acid ligase